MALTKAIIVLAGSKQANKLGKDINKATKDMTDKSITLSFAHEEYDYITVIKDAPATPQEARDLGGNMVKKYKSKVDEIVFEVTRLNDVKEGAALASYEFNKYKTKPKENNTNKYKCYRFQEMQEKRKKLKMTKNKIELNEKLRDI